MSRPSCSCVAWALALLLTGSWISAQPRSEPLNPVTETPGEDPLVVEGDARFARRALGHVGDRADDHEILAAIAAYDAALRRSPDSIEARWKLARALYFRGTYTGLDADRRRAVFDTARHVSEEAIAILARRAARGSAVAGFQAMPPMRIAEAARPDPQAAPTFFWAAVSWGQWALTVGKLQAVRAGAAAKIRDDAMVVIAIDPAFEEGGGYRILGRLHDQAPRIPLLTWWVSRRDALMNLRRAVAVGPKNIVNLHFLAEALARGSAGERGEALKLEELVVQAPASPEHLVEEIHIQEEARRNLAAWAGAAANRP